MREHRADARISSTGTINHSAELPSSFNFEHAVGSDTTAAASRMWKQESTAGAESEKHRIEYRALQISLFLSMGCTPFKVNGQDAPVAHLAGYE